MVLWERPLNLVPLFSDEGLLTSLIWWSILRSEHRSQIYAPVSCCNLGSVLQGGFNTLFADAATFAISHKNNLEWDSPRKVRDRCWTIELDLEDNPALVVLEGHQLHFKNGGLSDEVHVRLESRLVEKQKHAGQRIREKQDRQHPFACHPHPELSCQIEPWWKNTSRISTQKHKKSNLAKIFVRENFWKKNYTKNIISLKTPNLQGFDLTLRELGARSIWSCPRISVHGVVTPLVPTILNQSVT